MSEKKLREKGIGGQNMAKTQKTKEKQSKENVSVQDYETAESINDQASIMIAIALADPNPRTSVEELGKLISRLSNSEEYYQSLLKAVQNSKKKAIRALNDAKINGSMVTIKA